MPAPRRKIPAPFQRPSITVGGYSVKREWRWASPQEIQAGDIVPAVGKVSTVHVEYYDEEATAVMGYHVSGGEDNHTLLHPGSKVWAFTAVKS